MQVLKVKTHYTIYIFWLFIRAFHTIVLFFETALLENWAFGIRWRNSNGQKSSSSLSRCYRISKPKGQVTFRILTIAKTTKSVSISVKFFEILSDDKRKNSTKLNFIQPVTKSILGPSNIEYNGSHNSNAQQNFKTISVHEIDSLAPLTTTLVRKSFCKNMDF